MFVFGGVQLGLVRVPTARPMLNGPCDPPWLKGLQTQGLGVEGT